MTASRRRIATLLALVLAAFPLALAVAWLRVLVDGSTPSKVLGRSGAEGGRRFECPPEEPTGRATLRQDASPFRGVAAPTVSSAGAGSAP